MHPEIKQNKPGRCPKCGMDLKGFAQGYSTYDLLAQKVFSYGYIYPLSNLVI